MLITGGGGQLASDLAEQLRDLCVVSAPGRDELDITDQEAVDAEFARLKPAIVFNWCGIPQPRSLRTSGRPLV